MIVDGAGQFVTQRTHPHLALVDVTLTVDSVVLSAPGKKRLELPITASPDAARRRVRVWRDDVDAVECGAEASAWASDWIGSPASIVFMPDNVLRPVNPDHARDGDIVGFADGFPLLLASTSSLDDLNARLEQPVPMDRFRPNVVVTGCAPWLEDSWARIRVGDISLRVAKPCSRCVITTTDQRTAERGLEPLRTLATFRALGNDVLFAQNCIPEGFGTIAVGDPVVAFLP